MVNRVLFLNGGYGSGIDTIKFMALVMLFLLIIWLITILYVLYLHNKIDILKDKINKINNVN